MGNGVNNLRTAKGPAALSQLLLQGFFRIAAFLVLILVWQVISWSNIVAPNLLPSPATVFNTFVELLLRGGLMTHVMASAQRVVTGVIIGVTLAVPIGFILGWYKGAGKFLDSLINFMRALPPIALVPLVVVYMGIGESARLTVLVYAAFFSAVVVTYEGIVGLEPIYFRAARVMGATSGEIFFKVVLPLALPHILTAFRVALGVSWATLVAAELVAAQQGLGAMIQNASNFFQIPTIYVGIILIGLTALIMDQLLRVVINHFVSWRETV